MRLRTNRHKKSGLIQPYRNSFFPQEAVDINIIGTLCLIVNKGHLLFKFVPSVDNSLWVLVHWKNYGHEDDSWEPAKTFVNDLVFVAEINAHLGATSTLLIS